MNKRLSYDQYQQKNTKSMWYLRSGSKRRQQPFDFVYELWFRGRFVCLFHITRRRDDQVVGINKHVKGFDFPIIICGLTLAIKICLMSRWTWHAKIGMGKRLERESVRERVGMQFGFLLTSNWTSRERELVGTRHAIWDHYKRYMYIYLE